jgi:uncharacterized protein with HEPN domain
MASDRNRLNIILEAIGDIQRRLESVTYANFANDRDELALTAFRLSLIGENANKLSTDIQARHPELPWRDMYAFRNIVTHDYGIVAPRFVWAAVEDLKRLEHMCRMELAALS